MVIDPPPSGSFVIDRQTDIQTDAEWNIPLSIFGRSNFHLRALRHIRSSLTQDVANMMISSIIGSRIDYCNSLLIAISEQNLDRLQGVQSKSKAARIVCNAIIYIYEIGEIVFQTMPVVNILTTTDTSFGLRRFSVAGPRIWNGLPHELYDSATHTSVF